MKFSTKTSYGLRSISLLAKNYRQGSVSLSVISKIENISLKYLERVFSDLKKAKIVTSEKGKSGGYKLAFSPSEISVYDVIQALEGDNSAFHCIADDKKTYCNQGCSCSATQMLVKLQNAMYQTLKNIKLSDL